ncbi:uncharacterized protein J5F26_001709, partial [Ciconia maguari]
GPPGSPALSALVRLVKEIPEFLFGGPTAGAEPGAAGSVDVAAGSEQTGAGVIPEAPVESCPLRSLEKCLEELAVRGSGPPGPPASGSRAPGERQRGEPGGRQSLPGRRSLRGPAAPPGPSRAESPAAAARRCPQSGDGAGRPGSAGGISSASSATGAAAAWGQDGALAPVVPPGSLAETRASRPRGTAAPGDARPAGSTRPPSRPPAKGTATKRPPAEAALAGAASPPGSGVCPGGCGTASSPKKRRPRGTSPALWEPPGEAQHPRAEVGRVCAVLAEKLERPCRDLRSVRREVWGVRSRLERLERGWAREMAALAHCRRRLRHAIRRLEARCRALETRSWRNSLRLLGLPEGAEGADAVAFLQTMLPAVLGLPPAPAPLQIESARRLRGPTAPARPLLFSLLRFADKLALLRAARGCPEPPSWAGARLAIVPGHWAWRAVERPCGTRCPAAGRGRGSTGP